MLTSHFTPINQSIEQLEKTTIYTLRPNYMKVYPIPRLRARVSQDPTAEKSEHSHQTLYAPTPNDQSDCCNECCRVTPPSIRAIADETSLHMHSSPSSAMRPAVSNAWRGPRLRCVT